MVLGCAPRLSATSEPYRTTGLRSSLLSLLSLLRSLRIPGLAAGALAAGSRALVCLRSFGFFIFCWQAGAKPKPVFQRIDLEPWKGK